MIATERFLFLHLHKSGGTFVNALLMRHVAGARQLGYHLPYAVTPAEYRHLPVLGTVRSPFAYYVSWFHFQATRPKPNILYRLCSDEGRLGFAATTRQLAALAYDPPLLARVRDGLPEQFQAAGLNLTRSCLDQLEANPTGFYSFLYRRLYAGAPSPLVMCQERLRPALAEALSHFGYLPDADLESYLTDAPPRNASIHPPVRNCYDADLAALIGDLERDIVARHGYASPLD